MNVNLLKLITYLMLYLSYTRATAIALFLPSNERMLDYIDYTQQTIINYILILLLAGYIFLLNDYRFLQKFMMSPLVIILSIGMVCSVIFSIDLSASLKFILTVIVVTLPSVIFARTYGLKNLISQVSWIIITLTFLNLIYTILFPQYAIMTHDHDGRWKGLFEHKNGFGPFFSIGFFFVLRQVIYERSKFKIIEITALLIMFVFILKSGSATALICFTLMLLFFFLFSITFYQKSMERFAIYLGSACVIILILTFLGGIISQAIFDITGRDATLTGRTGIWEVLMGAVWQRPLLGYGAGMAIRPEFMQQFQAEIGWGASSAHNSFIDIFINFGIPIALIVTFLIFKYLLIGMFKNYTSRKQISYGALGCSLIIVIIGISFANSGALIGRSIFWMYMVIGILVQVIPLPSQTYNKHTE